MSYRWWVVIAVILFVIGIAFGMVTPQDNLLAEYLSATLKELGSTVVPFSLSTVMFIFLKNVSAMLLSFVLSPILCLVPVLTLVVNGWLLGFVSAVIVPQESFWYVLAGVLPHGVFELPAIIMAQAAALSFSSILIIALFVKGKRALIVPRFKQSLKFLLLAGALLIPAAIIETYITPLLLGS